MGRFGTFAGFAQRLLGAQQILRPLHEGGFSGNGQQQPILTPTDGLTTRDNVGKLPALGWNSWNAFRCDIDESVFLTAANKIVDSGLKDAGYVYVNIDDCWAQKNRDNVTQRMVPDFNKFPDGIKGTANKIHAMGLKLGIYSSAGTATCEREYPGSLGYEDIDAQTWADWDVDYVKYDNCNYPPEWRDDCNACTRDQVPENWRNASCDASARPDGDTTATNFCPPGYDYSKSKSAERYRRMMSGLEKAGRPILYSLCQYGEANVHLWGNATSHSWRTTADIFPEWPRILKIIAVNQFLMNSVNFWGHGDADMLEIGNGALNPAETRTHMALWSAMKSPLLIGTPMDKISNENLEILKNKFLLAFHQDGVYGGPAQPYKWGINPDWTFNVSYPAEFWSGNYLNGTLVWLFNPLGNTVTKTADYEEVPELKNGETYRVYDGWTGEDLGCHKDTFSADVQSHDTNFYLFKQECDTKKLRRGRWARGTLT